MGIVIAAIFILLNLFMVLALLSELNEFTSFNERAKELLLFGCLYLGLNLTVGVVMLVKYVKSIHRLDETGVAVNSYKQ